MLDRARQLMIKVESLDDAQDLLNKLKTTPVIEQPTTSIDFVEELSKKLRTEMAVQKERDNLAYQEMVQAYEAKLSKFE